MGTKPHVLIVAAAGHPDDPPTLDLRCPDGCDFWAYEECDRCQQAGGPTEDEEDAGRAHGVEHASTDFGWSAKTDRCLAMDSVDPIDMLHEAMRTHPELDSPGEHLVEATYEGEGWVSFAPWRDED